MAWSSSPATGCSTLRLPLRRALTDACWRVRVARVGTEDAREVAVHRGKSSYRYLGSLQLFVSRKIGGLRSLPQITLPARRGLVANAALRSRKYRLTARLHR